jgi:outer membrane lipoprotein-sorting protein
MRYLKIKKENVMKKKSILILLVMLGVMENPAAQDINAFTKKFASNQQKIKTLVAKGTMRIDMQIANSGKQNTTESLISIYMKHPDMFKMVMDGPQKIAMVQSGEYISQKVEGLNTTITNKILKGMDMFKLYFNYGIEDLTKHAKVQSQSKVQEGKISLTKFRIKTNQIINPNPQIPVPGDNLKIDYIELFFNQDGMLIRNSTYAASKEMVRMEIEYTQKEGIFLAKRIKSITDVQSMKFTSTITYTALDLNTPIVDREFSLE